MRRCAVPGVDDSKQLTAPERERAVAAVIRRQALGFAVAAVDPDVIDRINILEATRRAMVEALSAPSNRRPDCAVIDAVRL